MVWVVLPVKGFDKSKQRLAQVLNDHQRKRLAQAMLQDVLQAISNTKCINNILVVTGNADIARLSYHYNAQVLMEPDHCTGLNHAVDLGVKHAHFHGARKALILHADIPLVNSVDLMHVVHNHIDGGATLVPDKHEQGTNGMMLELPINLQFQYGEGSYHKHLKLLREKGLVCDIAELPDLTLDIDSPEDLLELSLRLIEKPVSATSECLRASDMQQALMDIRRAV